MKKSTFIFPLLLLISIVSFQSCETEDEGDFSFPAEDNSQSIADVVMANSELDSLEVALTRINLIKIFKDSSYTLFAPNNQAFRTYLDSNNYLKVADISETDLTLFMQYSTLWYRIVSDSLRQDHSLSTLHPNNLIIDRSNGLQLITTDTSQGPVNILTTNLPANNGLIHMVDQIIRH